MFPAILSAIRDFYARSFWTYPEAETQYGTGYVLSYSGRTWLSGANQLWIDEPARVDAQLLDTAVRFFRPHQAEWSIFILPQAQPGLQERLLSLGAYTRWSSPLMVLDGLSAQAHPLPWVDVKPIRGAVARQAAHQIIAEAFHMHPEVSPRMVRPEDEHNATLAHVMGYVEGQPAGVATMCLTSGIASIWNVGTRRQFRRRGVAHALMVYLIRQAHAAGYAQSMLLASSMGQPLYQNLGYQIIGYVQYMGVIAY